LASLVAIPPAALIVFRESLEAGLVSTIVLAYLRRTGRQEYSRYVYLGATLGVLASVVLGLVFAFLLAEAGEEYGTLFGIGAGLLAAAVLTYMVVWTSSNASRAQERVERRLNVFVSGGYAAGVTLIGFSTVIREGMEAVLFLLGLGGLDAEAAVGGGILGTIASLVALYALASRLNRMNLKKVFRVSSLLLVVIASGMLLHSANGLSQYLALNNIGGSFAAAKAYDLGIPDDSVFSDEGVVGGLFSAFTGYLPSASWLAVSLYVLYWLGAGSFIYRSFKASTDNATWLPSGSRR